MANENDANQMAPQSGLAEYLTTTGVTVWQMYFKYEILTLPKLNLND